MKRKFSDDLILKKISPEKLSFLIELMQYKIAELKVFGKISRIPRTFEAVF